jgi:tetratricopeptide (TPR) repeat protein
VIRTSTRNAILGPPGATAILLTFAGRKSVALEGALSDSATQRNVALTKLMYGDEEELHRFCRDHGIAFVLYSVEYLLDTSRYSLRYRAGVTTLDESAIFWQMHFSPHALRGFTLVYENDHYRLFRVSEGTEPVFLTDHPPVYQSEAWASAGGDIDAFRRLNTELIITYSEAIKQREKNDYSTAINMFTWCLERAPRFTLARIGLAETLMRSDRLEEARDVMLSVVRIAPDNERALYGAAYLHAQLGETAQATALLEIFFTVATEPVLIDRAKLLKTLLDQGVPLVPR